MKNVFKLMLPVFLLISGVEVKAADVFDVKVSDDRILMVKLEEAEEGATLSFEDKNGEVLFRDNLTKNGYYSKAFNLEVIPAGVYYLKLEKENSILTTEVTKTRSGLELTGKSSSIIFKPCFKVTNKLVQVFLTNPGEGSAYFSILDTKGNVVTSMAYNDLVVNKTLDFSKIPAGEYTISVRVSGKTFNKIVSIG